MDRFVIAISRTYGSGGGTVGKRLAAALGIPCYNRAIIEMAAEKSGLSADYMKHLEDHLTSSFLFNLASASMIAPAVPLKYDVPVSYTAFSAQSEVIRELAERSSCIIIGRCSDYILRDDPNCVKVFLHADREDRLRRIVDDYGVSADSAKARLNKVDKARANYYKNFTGERWADLNSYDLCISTSGIGTSGAADVIQAYLRKAKMI